MSPDEIRYYWRAFLGYLPTLIWALVLLGVGMVIIRVVVTWGKRRLIKSDADPTLVLFLGSTLKFVLQLTLLFSVISLLGVPTTSFLAILGAAGLAVGLALKDSLAHFASGVLIILFKPFRVGDLVKAKGHLGTVERITMLYTYLKTFDNQQVILPNGFLAGDTVINQSAYELRRVDLPFGVAYKDSLDKVRQVMLGVSDAHPLTLLEPGTQVTVDGWADSSVTVTLRTWCKTEDYFRVAWDLQEQVKNAFNEHGLEIPFPHQVSINQFPDLRPVLNPS